MSNFILRADKGVEGLHQDIVDLTQKPGKWLSMQCVYGCFVTLMLKDFMYQGFGFGTVMSLVGITLMGGFVYTRPGGIPSEAFGMWRPFLILFVLLALINLCLMPGGYYALKLLNEVLFMSILYFITCKPPRPRVPKTRLAPQT